MNRCTAGQWGAQLGMQGSENEGVGTGPGPRKGVRGFVCQSSQPWEPEHAQQQHEVHADTQRFI